MAEWTIEITSTIDTEDVEEMVEAVERVAASLDASSALGPSTSANLVDGIISATYQVEAADQAAARHAGEELFLEALLFGRVDPSIRSCDVRPAEEA